MNSTIKTNNVTIPRSTAELAVPRAMKLLRTLGTDSVVLAAMKQTGFDIDDMKQGWSLVLKACSAPTVDAKFAPHTGPVADATQKIEAWQSTMFLRAHAALRRLHPAQDTFLFENLATGTGVAAVVAVSMFLERLDALESSADRKASRKADHAALATLEKRGVTKDERKQIHSLVQLVETTPAPAVVDVAPSPDVRMAALVELHAWVQDWSDCARAVITRRDQLLRLGIGKRRARAVAAPAPQPEPAPQPQPAPAPPALPEPAPAQVTAPSLLALPAKSNGMSNGAIVLAAGGTHA